MSLLCVCGGNGCVELIYNITNCESNTFSITSYLGLNAVRKILLSAITMSGESFPESGAQNTRKAAMEAKEWIEVSI